MNVLYVMLTEGMDKAEHEAFDRQLESKPIIAASRMKAGGRIPAPGEVEGVERMMALMALPQAGG